jgi:hypothetical protein
MVWGFEVGRKQLCMLRDGAGACHSTSPGSKQSQCMLLIVDVSQDQTRGSSKLPHAALVHDIACAARTPRGGLVMYVIV